MNVIRMRHNSIKLDGERVDVVERWDALLGRWVIVATCVSDAEATR